MFSHYPGFTTSMEILNCTEPKSHTMKFIQFDGQPYTEHIWKGTTINAHKKNICCSLSAMSRSYKLISTLSILFFLLTEKYCDIEFFSGICARNGFLIPKNITRPYEIEVKIYKLYVFFSGFILHTHISI